MKALHLSNLTTQGGEVTYVTNLIEYQAKYIHVVNHNFSSLEDRFYFKLNKDKYVLVLESMRKSIELLDLIDLSSYDVFHCHTWYTALAGVALKIMFPEKKLVFLVHSLETLRPWKRDSLGVGYNLSSYLESMVLKTADDIVVSSTGCMENLREYLPSSEMNKVSIIPPGINEVFKVNQLLDKEFSLLRHSEKPFIFVGRGTKQKGIEYIIQAAKYLQSNAKIYLFIGKYDNCDYQQKLESLISKYPDKIVYTRLNWVHQKQVAAIMQSGYVFCSPSIYETFGLTAAEANMSGLPVIGTNIAGTADIIIEGINGYLVNITNRSVNEIAKDFARRIDFMYTNEDDTFRLRKNALMLSSRYSWDRAAKEFIRLYENR